MKKKNGLLVLLKSTTAEKMKFTIKDFCSKCDQIRSFLRMWSHLLKKSLVGNFIFCAVYIHDQSEVSHYVVYFVNFE